MDIRGSTPIPFDDDARHQQRQQGRPRRWGLRHVRRAIAVGLLAIVAPAVVACAHKDGTAAGARASAPGPPLDTAAEGVILDPAAVDHDVPDIDATAFAVYNVTDDQWLVEQNANDPLPVGSVMKLLTSYVVLQAGDLDKIVTVPDLPTDIDESVIGLYAGEELPRDVLLRAMLIVSANDAARALALDVGGSIDAFVTQMNASAREVGMANTIAANPVGLDAEGAHSTAHDMIVLATRLMSDDTFRQAVMKPSATLHGQTFDATNDLLGSYDGATGVKTGHTTQAGYCLIGSAERDGRELIVAVFGARSDASRLQSAASLLDWGFSQP